MSNKSANLPQQPEVKANINLNRRRFMQVSATVAGGLLFQFNWLPVAQASDNSAGFASGYLEFTKAGEVIFTLPRLEMGQGVAAGLVTLIAEELNLNPHRISVAHINVGFKQRNTAYKPKNTGGSGSMRGSWTEVRQAGAQVRLAFQTAAAQRWQCQVQDCELADGQVVYPGAAKQVSMVELLPDIAKINLPKDQASVKSIAEFKYIGHENQVAPEVADKVFGHTQYGIDSNLDFPVAAILAAPGFGQAELISMDSDGVKAMKGVLDVIPLSAGVAIIAENTWLAFQAKEKLSASIKWDESSSATLDSDKQIDTYRNILSNQSGETVASLNKQELAGAQLTTIEQEFVIPYLSHAPMEPLTCAVDVSDSKCEIWCATQRPPVAIQLAAEVTGLPIGSIQLNCMTAGGSFGRRLCQDFLVEAVELGSLYRKPVKVVWSKEDTIQRGRFRPNGIVKLKAEVDSDGNPKKWRHEVVSPGELWYSLPFELNASLLKRAKGAALALKKELTGEKYDDHVSRSAVIGDSATAGAKWVPYSIPNYKVKHHPIETSVPVGFWRSVGHSINSFTIEVFLDQIAHQYGKDPLTMRLDLLNEYPRVQTALRRVAALANWGERGKQRPLGISCFFGYNTVVATIAELAPLAKASDYKVEKIYSVVDCGIMMNPDIVRQQIESSIVMGLSMATHEKVDVKGGVAVQSNYDSYSVLRLEEMPELVIETVASQENPGGIGEPVVPTIASALVNAIRWGTGEHITDLPLLKS